MRGRVPIILPTSSLDTQSVSPYPMHYHVSSRYQNTETRTIVLSSSTMAPIGQNFNINAKQLQPGKPAHIPGFRGRSQRRLEILLKVKRSLEQPEIEAHILRKDR